MFDQSGFQIVDLAEGGPARELIGDIVFDHETNNGVPIGEVVSLEPVEPDMAIQPSLVVEASIELID